MGARQIDTGTEGLRAHTEDGVATLRIDRPQARGALTAAMWAAIPGILATFAHDPDTSVLVLTGTDGVFSAGADIHELLDHYATAEAADAYHALSAAAEQALAAFPKPTIALISGACVGGGCQLATACDLRFADETARLGITPAKLGIVYDAVSTRRTAALVGASAAKYLLFSGELIDAAHALRIGLLDQLWDRDEAPQRAYDFARTVASRSQLTVRAAKDLIDAPSLDLARVRAWEQASRTSSDVREGLAAFIERRAPHFTWNGGAPSGAV
ncbi:enoyl-CoA hydratase/isomerase family protein [Wenjunlia tyrosinilytica]|jgi:enoyl-CoA hydratase/carnithine racemase|uniref:Enoyl-CoA hydratase n=1 Tax=Wenjunlia tyrosinilytica TaxID=1544741 RepID=A0A917ZX89_9ACTN|nr:enoyl-CoA hydratase-related protein [Wenjunlia tyrosinilytica]GGO96878.1 enoyl-CoA hydratase [Wenjunlia tyrosinilytica]